MSPARTANLGLAFVLELAALALWGAHVGSSMPVRVAVTIAAVAAWAVVWGLCFSPRARSALSPTAKQWGKVGMFAIAAVALGGSGRWALAVVFAVVAAANRVLIAVWGQEVAQQTMQRNRR